MSAYYWWQVFPHFFVPWNVWICVGLFCSCQVPYCHFLLQWFEVDPVVFCPLSFWEVAASTAFVLFKFVFSCLSVHRVNFSFSGMQHNASPMMFWLFLLVETASWVLPLHVLPLEDLILPPSSGPDVDSFLPTSSHREYSGVRLSIETLHSFDHNFVAWVIFVLFWTFSSGLFILITLSLSFCC